jgi:mobilization protein NikA
MKAERKRCAVTARVTSSELEKIKALAAARGLDMSNWMREALLGESGQERVAQGPDRIDKIAKRLEMLIEIFIFSKQEEIETGKPLTMATWEEICDEAVKHYA